MEYKPLEFAAPPELAWVLDEPGFVARGVHNNPPVHRRKRKPEIILPSEEFKSLRVQVAVIRDEGYDLESAPIVSSGGDVSRLFDFAANLVQESMWVLILNAKHKVLGIYEVGRGTGTSVEVQPADIMRPILVAGGKAFILVHNHPSGDPEASLLDVELTTRVNGAGALLGLVLLDHVVVGFNGKFYSLAEHGRIH